MDKIKEILIHLKADFGFNGRRLAERLGINENYLSRVSNGNAPGSKQLLAGLQLLLELETLKRKPQPLTLQEQVEALQSRLNALETGKYPDMKPRHYQMNEAAKKSEANPVLPPTGAEDAKRIAALAEKQLETDKRPRPRRKGPATKP